MTVDGSVSRVSLPGSSQLDRAKKGDQFLQFSLGDDINALLNVQHIAEIITVTRGQVIPIPHMPAWVMGVYNWRGEILWIADLGHLIGLSPMHQQVIPVAHYSILVLHEARQKQRDQRHLSAMAGRKLLGVAVAEVQGMQWHESSLIQSPPGYAITPEVVPFLRGYLVRPEGDLSLVLDGGAVLSEIAQRQSP